MAIINKEMRENAEEFIFRWRGTTAERAEAQTFTNESFCPYVGTLIAAWLAQKLFGVCRISAIRRRELLS